MFPPKTRRRSKNTPDRQLPQIFSAIACAHDGYPEVGTVVLPNIRDAAPHAAALLREGLFKSERVMAAAKRLARPHERYTRVIAHVMKLTHLDEAGQRQADISGLSDAMVFRSHEHQCAYIIGLAAGLINAGGVR